MGVGAFVAIDIRAMPGVTAWPSAARAWWAIVVCCICAILSYTDRQVLAVLVDPLRSDLGITDTQVSLLQGMAFAVVYSVAGFPLGRAADIWPRRRVIMLGVLVWSAATVACGLVQTFGSLFAARIFVGIGEAALAPAVLSMIGDLFPLQRRGLAIAVFSMGMILGAGAAVAVAGWLLQSAASGLLAALPLVNDIAPWRAVLLVLAVPGILVWLLLLTVREPVRRGVETTGVELPTLAEVGKIFNSRKAVVLPLLGAMGLMAAGDFSLLNWTPALLARVYHLNPGHIGSVLGSITIAAGGGGAVLAGLVSGPLVRRAGGMKNVLLGCVLAASLAIFCAALAFSTRAEVALICFSVWMVLSQMAGTLGVTAIQATVPNEIRGLTTACTSFCNIFGGLGLGTLATALLSDHVFHDVLAVGKSVGIVIGLSATCAAGLFALSLRAFPRRSNLSAGAFS
jgi:MFS family permease